MMDTHFEFMKYIGLESDLKQEKSWCGVHPSTSEQP